MSKDEQVNPSSSDQATMSHASCSLKISSNENNQAKSPLSIGDEGEWNETECPICREHPHNAVLLICSSNEQGCRPFMCDTSYRHSNCLDQYHKSSASSEQPTEYVCPLCRGTVTEWVAIEDARSLMNAKTRSCSSETCDFIGNYSELRKHARIQHPYDRPSAVSPTRQLDWKKQEEERNREDAALFQYDFMDDLSDGSSDHEWGSDFQDHQLDLIFSMNPTFAAGVHNTANGIISEQMMILDMIQRESRTIHRSDYDDSTRNTRRRTSYERENGSRNYSRERRSYNESEHDSTYYARQRATYPREHDRASSRNYRANFHRSDTRRNSRERMRRRDGSGVGPTRRHRCVRDFPRYHP